MVLSNGAFIESFHSSSPELETDWDWSTESLRQTMLEYAKILNDDRKKEWIDVLKLRLGEDYDREYMPQPLAEEHQKMQELPQAQETSTEDQMSEEISKVTLGNFVEQVVCDSLQKVTQTEEPKTLGNTVEQMVYDSTQKVSSSLSLQNNHEPKATRNFDPSLGVEKWLGDSPHEVWTLKITAENKISVVSSIRYSYFLSAKKLFQDLLFRYDDDARSLIDGALKTGKQPFISSWIKRVWEPGGNKSSTQGVKWSIGAGTNLLQGFAGKVGREAKQRLNEFAKELKSFRSVDMSGCNFGDEGLFFLAESLWYNRTVEEVRFSANGITTAGVKALDVVLQSNIGLKVLNLFGNPIGDVGAKTLCVTLMKNSSIEILQLNRTDLGDEGAKEIAEFLKRNSTLRVSELNNNMIDNSEFTSLVGALLENNTIRNLHLNRNYGGVLGANALAKGLEGNKSLRELHLHGNSIGDEWTRALMAGLSSHKGKLVLLDLDNNSITAKVAFYVAEYIKRSKSWVWLNLYMNDIGDEGAEKIADVLKQNRSIATIGMGGNNIHAEGINDIAQVLKDDAIITTLEIAAKGDDQNANNHVKSTCSPFTGSKSFTLGCKYLSWDSLPFGNSCEIKQTHLKKIHETQGSINSSDLVLNITMLLCSVMGKIEKAVKSYTVSGSSSLIWVT